MGGWVCNVFVVVVSYRAYINVWRYVVINVQIYTCVQSVEDGGGASVCGCVLAWGGEFCVCARANQEKGKMKTSQQEKMIDDDFPVL